MESQCLEYLPDPTTFLRVVVLLSAGRAPGSSSHRGYPIIATAILDRLLHHSVTINIKGESYRLKEKQKAGVLKQPVGPA